MNTKNKILISFLLAFAFLSIVFFLIFGKTIKETYDMRLMGEAYSNFLAGKKIEESDLYLESTRQDPCSKNLARFLLFKKTTMAQCFSILNSSLDEKGKMVSSITIGENTYCLKNEPLRSKSSSEIQKNILEDCIAKGTSSTSIAIPASEKTNSK